MYCPICKEECHGEDCVFVNEYDECMLFHLLAEKTGAYEDGS